MDLYQDDEEPCDAGVPTPYLEPASVLEPIPMPVAKPCVPTTSPGIPASSHATQEDSDEDEDIWAKACRGRAAGKAGGRKPTVRTPELAKAVGQVAAAAVSAALAAGMHCTGAKGCAAAVPADAAVPAQGPGIPASSHADVGPEHNDDVLAPEHKAAGSGKQRAPRGSAGTFAGRRPPINPQKLAAFKAAREAHIASKKELKKKRKKARKEGQQQDSEGLKEAMSKTLSTYPGAVKAPLLPKEKKKKCMKKRPSACVCTQKPVVVAENDNGTVGASISIAESSEVAVA